MSKPKKPKPYKGKVKKEHKDRLKLMLAQDHSQADVVIYFADHMELEVAPSLVSYYADVFSDDIRNMRTKYNEQLVTQAPITTKEYRYRIYQKLLDDIMGRLWLEIPKVQKQVENGEVSFTEYTVLKGNHDTATKILLAIAKEQEGEEPPAAYTDILTASRDVQVHYIKTGEVVTEVEIQAMKMKVKVTKSEGENGKN